jgi:hypothetical protein
VLKGTCRKSLLGNLKAVPVADVESEAVVLDEIDLLDDICNRFVDCETILKER